MKMIVKRKQDTKLLILLSSFILLFSVMKVLRGADYGNATEGGIWNLISLMYFPIFIVALLRKRYIRLDSVFLISFLYIAATLISIASNGNFSLTRDSIYYLLMIPYPFVVLYTFYLGTKEGKTAKMILLAAYFLCLVINLVTILRYVFASYNRPMANDVYFSLCLFPFMLLFLENKGLKTVAIVAQFAASFFADKRAGFLAFCFAIVVYILVQNGQKSRAKLLNTVKAIIISLLVIVVLYYATYILDKQFNLKIFSRLLRLSKDEGSGRSKLYSLIWNDYLHAPWWNKLFGHGFGSVRRHYGVGHAHNDFLEALYAYGLVSCACIVLFYGSLIGKAVQLIQKKSKNAAAFSASIVIAIFLGFFSYFLIYYTYVTCITAFWGYVLALEMRKDAVPKNRIEADQIEKVNSP